MKKTLFMCALGLTVATSMVAGTMAIYTHTDTLLQDETATARAKKFYIGVNNPQTAAVDIKLAPGQYADWNFTATNIDPATAGFMSEVNTDLVIKISDAKVFNWKDFQIQLFVKGNEAGAPIAVGTVADDNTVTLEAKNEYLAYTEKTSDYTLRFIWNDTDAAGLTEDQFDLVNGKTEDQMPNVTNFNVTVTGRQSTTDKPVINGHWDTTGQEVPVNPKN